MKKIVGLLLMFVFMMTGCSSEKTAGPAKKDEVVISVGVNMTAGGYDPIAGYGVWGPDIFHSKLLKYNVKSELETDLATAYEISKDGLTYTYHLRQDAKFADGTPLTARDVVFTYTKAKDSGSAADLTMLAGVKAVDDYTVVFTLNKPWSVFTSTTATIGIVSQAAYNEKYGDNPLASGPWKVAQFQKDQQLILVPNEHYYGQKPKLKKVTILKLDEEAALAAAKSGQLDLVLVETEFAKTKVAGMHLAELETVTGLVINLPMVKETTTADGKVIGNNVTSDWAIRKALNIGIDRKLIVQNALNGIGDPAYGWSAALPWGNAQAAFADNQVEEAKKILTNAGWIDTDGDGIREKNGLKAEFVVTGRSNDLQRYNTVVAVAADAKKLGINIIPKAAPWNECRLAQATPTCWVFGSHNPMDVYRYYHSSQMGKGVIGNPSSYANPKVDAYIDQALAATSSDKVDEYWRLAQWDGTTGMKEDYPYLWIANTRLTYFIKDGLDIGKQRVHVRSQGIPVVENLAEWSWQ